MPRNPLWAEIARSLRAEIAAGQYRAGERLPTEAALAARFAVNRHTIRHALAALAQDGAIRTRQGAGAFVAEAPAAEYPLGRRVRFHQNISATGRVPSRQILQIVTRHPDPEEAAALQLTADQRVHVAEGISLADAVPLAAFRSVFPADRLPDLPGRLQQHQSITAALAGAGVADYTRATTRLTAVAADALLALRLQLRDGAPLLRSVSVNVDGGGAPVEFGITWFAGERVALTVQPEAAQQA